MEIISSYNFSGMGQYAYIKNIFKTKKNDEFIVIVGQQSTNSDIYIIDRLNNRKNLGKIGDIKSVVFIDGGYLFLIGSTVSYYDDDFNFIEVKYTYNWQSSPLSSATEMKRVPNGYIILSNKGYTMLGLNFEEVKIEYFDSETYKGIFSFSNFFIAISKGKIEKLDYNFSIININNVSEIKRFYNIVPYGNHFIFSYLNQNDNLSISVVNPENLEIIKTMEFDGSKTISGNIHQSLWGNGFKIIGFTTSKDGFFSFMEAGKNKFIISLDNNLNLLEKNSGEGVNSDKHTILPDEVNGLYIASILSRTTISFIDFNETRPSNGVETQPGQPETDVDNEGGDGDRSSDDIYFPSDTVNANNITSKSYILNFTGINGINNFLWSKDFSEMLVGLVGLGVPQSAIISCQLFPFDLVEGFNGRLENYNFLRIGNKNFPINNAKLVGWSYDRKIEVGEYRLNPFFGGFLDYEPYTRISIFIPFSGLYSINPSLITGKTLKLYYIFDVVTGEAKAILEVEGKVIGSYPSQLSTRLFFSSIDEGKNLEAFSSGVLTSAVTSIATANPLPLISTVGMQTLDSMMTPATVESSSPMTGLLDRKMHLDSYLIITRPETAVAKGYNKIYGRPSQITLKLSDCKGFTSCDKPMISIKGTDKEREMIESLLKEGVVIK